MNKSNIPFKNTFPKYPDKTIILDKKIDSSLINKLFLLFQENNISVIKNFLISNNLTLNINHHIINENDNNNDGDTILHLILKNNSLSKYDKTTLVKFLSTYGTIPMSFNKFNVTPLHLAVKYQLSDVIPLLIQHGHNVNATDSMLKTPLHYAVTGENTSCDTFEQPILVPQQKKNDDININLIKKILQYINNFIIDNNNKINFINIIKNDIINDIKKSYNNINELKTNYNNFITLKNAVIEMLKEKFKKYLILLNKDDINKDDINDNENVKIIKTLIKNYHYDNDNDNDKIKIKLLINKLFILYIDNFIIYFSNKIVDNIIINNDISFNINNIIPHVDTINIDVSEINDNINEILNKDKLTDYSSEDVIFEQSHKKKLIVYGLGMTDVSSNYCYNYDNDITTILLNNYANVNARDIDGNSPIYDAINMGNEIAVKTLIDKTIIFNDNYRNKFGFTAFDYSLNNLNFVIDNIFDDTFIQNITDKANEELFKKTQYKSTMKYNNIILKMMFYLVNHQLYFLHQNEFNNINSIPLFESIQNYEFPSTNIFETKINEKITQYTNILQNSEEKAKILEKIHEKIHGKEESKEEKEEIKEEIKEELKEMTNKIKQLKNKKGEEIKEIKRKEIKEKGKNGKYYMNKYNNDIIDIYNNYGQQYKIINNKYIFEFNFKLYSDLWVFFINNEKYVKDIIIKIKTNINPIIKIKTDINPINKYNDTKKYNNIVEFIKNYFDLPNEYNKLSNYAIEIIMKIIIHVIKHTICINLYYVIIKLLKSHLIGLNETETETETEIKNILNKDDSEIIKYIMDILPEKIVKKVLNIYENENDLDKNIDIETYFKNINILLMNNDTVILSDSSQIINILNDIIYLYFIKYMSIYIKYMKQIIDNYFRNLLTLNNQLNIVVLLLEKKDKMNKN